MTTCSRCKTESGNPVHEPFCHYLTEHFEPPGSSDRIRVEQAGVWMRISLHPADLTPALLDALEQSEWLVEAVRGGNDQHFASVVNRMMVWLRRPEPEGQQLMTTVRMDPGVALSVLGVAVGDAEAAADDVDAGDLVAIKRELMKGEGR